MAPGCARDQLHRLTRDFEFLGEETNESVIGGAAYGRSGNPGLEHTLAGHAVDTIQPATRHQPHCEPGRGTPGVEAAAVCIHHGLIMAVVQETTPPLMPQTRRAVPPDVQTRPKPCSKPG